ncbi:MAG TPA: hypothetical protein VK861_11045 [Bacteroidales bacterium]|nr:hypothetical protein [Bacteroidales bacterium]
MQITGGDMMIRYDDRKEPMKFKDETGFYLLVSGVLAALAGIFWQPAILGGISVILGFLAMKSPKGAWGIPVFILGLVVMISSIYR